MRIPVPFAVFGDITARGRTLTIAEQTLATTLIGDASNLIMSEYRSANLVDDLIVDGVAVTDTEEVAARTLTLKRIVVAMVKRSMPEAGDESEENASEIQQTAGPFGYRVKVLNPSGDLYITKTERHSLFHQTAFTVPMAYDELS